MLEQSRGSSKLGNPSSGLPTYFLRGILGLALPRARCSTKIENRADHQGSELRKERLGFSKSHVALSFGLLFRSGCAPVPLMAFPPGFSIHGLQRSCCRLQTPRAEVVGVRRSLRNNR